MFKVTIDVHKFHFSLFLFFPDLSNLWTRDLHKGKFSVYWGNSFEIYRTWTKRNLITSQAESDMLPGSPPDHLPGAGAIRNAYIKRMVDLHQVLQAFNNLRSRPSSFDTNPKLRSDKSTTLFWASGMQCHVFMILLTNYNMIYYLTWFYEQKKGFAFKFCQVYSQAQIG